jgi:hypothetical protein
LAIFAAARAACACEAASFHGPTITAGTSDAHACCRKKSPAPATPADAPFDQHAVCPHCGGDLISVTPDPHPVAPAAHAIVPLCLATEPFVATIGHGPALRGEATTGPSPPGVLAATSRLRL